VKYSSSFPFCSPKELKQSSSGILLLSFRLFLFSIFPQCLISDISLMALFNLATKNPRDLIIKILKSESRVNLWIWRGSSHLICYFVLCLYIIEVGDFKLAHHSRFLKTHLKLWRVTKARKNTNDNTYLSFASFSKQQIVIGKEKMRDARTTFGDMNRMPGLARNLLANQAN
jgi:hypothetical protein